MSIIWLASYPKSGNTWIRAFLANYRREKEGAADINQLGSPVASRRHEFDEIVGVEASDLTFPEIDSLRPEFYRYLAAHNRDPLFQKIHDAYSPSLVPPDATRGAIYILRNPLDVAVSFADHLGASLPQTVAWMGDKTFALSSGRMNLAGQLRQRLSTWSGHVLSWVDQSDFPVHLIRYEDLSLCACDTFAAALEFLGMACDAERLSRAVENSTFEKLQQQEKISGFTERPPVAEVFFRKGQVGGWREALTLELVERVMKDHGEVMRRFGYLTGAGDYPAA